MGVLHTIALVANTTSRIPFATGEWRGHFKNVGMYSRRIAYRDSCYMNKQVSRILEILYQVTQFPIDYVYLYTGRPCASPHTQGGCGIVEQVCV